MDAKRPNSLINEYLYGRAFYPAAPLSWMAPLWAFGCGVAASAAWTWTGNNLLRLLSGLLLVGPLLGIAWQASARIRGRQGLEEDPPGDLVQRPILTLPYTLSGSASHRLGTRLATALAWWQRVRSYLGKPLLQLAGSTVFSLSVAAQLGQQSLALTAAALFIAYASMLRHERWASSPIISLSVPLFTAWLLGHALYSALRLVSVFVAGSFALACYSSSAPNSELKPLGPGLVWQVASQVAVVACLIAIRQPVVAAIVALLGTLQVLLAPLLATEHGHEQYFHTVQFQLAMSMFLTALALGYKP